MISRVFVLLTFAGIALLAQAATPKLLSAHREFTINLKAAPGAVIPLFGPVMETEWDPSWQPRILHLKGSKNQPTFAVFQVGAEDKTSTWVLTTFDPASGHVQYVNVRPGIVATLIDIQCSPAPNGTTGARVRYTRSALSAEGNAEVEHFAREFTSEAAHWEQAINECLQRKEAKK